MLNADLQPFYSIIPPSRDNDGVIWPQDTFVGFRRLGFGYIISTLAVPFIHGSFSYPTQSSWLPDPFFRIYMKNMHKTKHGSDSETYDTEGAEKVQSARLGASLLLYVP